MVCPCLEVCPLSARQHFTPGLTSSCRSQACAECPPSQPGFESRQGDNRGDSLSVVPILMFFFTQECVAWIPKLAKRSCTTWSHSSILLCSRDCREAPTTTPLLVKHHQTHPEPSDGVPTPGGPLAVSLRVLLLLFIL